MSVNKYKELYCLIINIQDCYIPKYEELFVKPNFKAIKKLVIGLYAVYKSKLLGQIINEYNDNLYWREVAQICHNCRITIDPYQMSKDKNSVYKIISLMIKFYESNYYYEQHEELNKFKDLSLDCLESMTEENTLKSEVGNLQLEYNNLIIKIDQNEYDITDISNQIHTEEQEIENQKILLHGQKEYHLNQNNLVGELRHTTQNLNQDISLCKEKVVEDPEETLKKKNESKSRLVNSTQDLNNLKAKYKKLNEYYTQIKNKERIADEFAMKLNEILQTIKENNDYKNKLEDTKHMYKETESELIYTQNQFKYSESTILNIQEELNKLTNDFSQEKRHKDIYLNESIENLDKYKSQYSELSAEIDKLSNVSHKQRIQELNQYRLDMDSVIEIYNKKNAEIKEYMENLNRMCNIFSKFNAKYVEAIQKVANEYKELINKIN